MKEREISLIDLMVEILLRWRVIIVCMLVGGLLMGGLSYVRSVRSVSAQNKAAEQEQQKDEKEILAQLEERLTPMQKNNVHAVLNYEDFADYYNHSLLMQIDAANVPKTELVFWIKGDSPEQSNNIKCLYESAVSNGIAQWLKENITEQMDVDLSELITVVNVKPDEMSNSFTVQTIHLTEKECDALADKVEEYMNYLHKNFTADIEEHDITLANRSFASVMDIDLLNWQRTMVTNITAGNTNADKIKTSFSAEEARYYNLLKKEKISEENGTMEEESNVQLEEQLVSVQKPSVSMKYILLGMALFAFLYVFCIFLKYILNNKLRFIDNFNEIYDIPQLGSIPQIVAQKKFLGFVDGWILKLRDSNKRVFSVEEATGLAAVAVKMAAQKENMNEVFCIGCNVAERTRKVAEQLEDMLKEGDITLNILNNVLYDQEVLEQLSSAKCVFLLETAGGTFYEEIVKELELLRRQEIKVLGGIIVG